MAHVKLITPGAQDLHGPTVQEVKVPRSGKLRGADLTEFMKRASVQFTDKLASMKLQPGEVPVHLLALGAEEYYGFNRNGDGFKEAVCQKCHPTFQKYARWYRDHQNKDVAKGRGIIKASAYNGEMKRVELIVALNGTKEAADRNGGLVADEELEKLARGEDIPVSMACRVSHDICSGCGNKAKSRAEYCGPEMCKYGGCRDNLAKTFDDGSTLGVYNPDPAFFDISKVFRPADRIAYTIGMAKAAADYQTMLKNAGDLYGADRSSGALAEKLGVSAPLWLLAADGPWTDPRIVGQLKIANDLINMEQAIAADDQPVAHDRAFISSVRPLCADTPDIRQGPFKLAHVVTALAAEKCLMPLDSFLAMLTGDTNIKTAADQVAERLPGIFTKLAGDPTLENDLRNNPYMPGGPAPRRIKHWVLKHAAEWSLDRKQMIQRLQLSTLRSPEPQQHRRPMTKIAMVDNVDELAKQYALYQLGFLQANAAAPDAEFLQEQTVRSNFVR